MKHDGSTSRDMIALQYVLLPEQPSDITFGDFGSFGQIWGDLRQILSKVEVTQIFLGPPYEKKSLYSSNIA